MITYKEIYETAVKILFPDDGGSSYRLADIFNFENDRTAKELICKFFSEHDKLDLLGKDKDTTFEELSKGNRAQHMISTMLLGLYFYEKTPLRKYIDKFISRYNVNGLKINFRYLWGIICLFHDYAYKFEVRKTNPQIIKPLYEEAEDFFNAEIYPIQKAFHDNDFKPRCGVIGQYVGVSKIYKDVYKKMLCNNDNYCDHGVCGGLLLFNRLCKIRLEESEWQDSLICKSAESEHVNKIRFEKVLCWDKRLIDVYNVAAWVIICHNLWPEKIIGKDYIKGEYYIELSKHPLLFLFCLVDTIDPVKFISQNYKEAERKDNLFNLLENIKIDIVNEGVNLIGQITASEFTCDAVKKYDLKLKSDGTINSWLAPLEISSTGIKIVLDNY